MSMPVNLLFIIRRAQFSCKHGLASRFGGQADMFNTETLSRSTSKHSYSLFKFLNITQISQNSQAYQLHL